MQTYCKIETLFNRATDGTKKLILGDWRNETFKYLADNKWVWTEKIDGTNIRVFWDGHRVSFGGRTDNAQIRADLMNYLITTFSSEETEQLFEQKFGETQVILFGEGYGGKIQNGGNDRKDVSLILFDVLVGNMWLKRESVEDIAKAFGIDVVPVIGTGTLEEAWRFVKTAPKSTIGTAYMEGLVVRPEHELYDRRGNRVIAKIKVRDFIRL